MRAVLLRKWQTLCRVWKETGALGVSRTVFRRMLVPLLDASIRPWTESRLRRIRDEQPDRRPLVVLSTVDWAFPYRQRPHHLAAACAALGRDTIYISPCQGHDAFVGLHCEEDGRLLVTYRLDAVRRVWPDADILILSTDWRLDAGTLADWQAGGHRLIYDYIDVMDASIQRRDVEESHRSLHRRLLADPSVVVVASAEALVRDAETEGAAEVHLITNGVDIEHFRVSRDRGRLVPELAAVVEQGRPIFGYYGALAAWIDLDLICEAARQMPEAAFVMMGPVYDESFEASEQAMPDNLHILPPVRYPALPAQAVFFDVCLVPFRAGALSDAVSPLKLFEYMALGKPIVATDVAECARYRSVITAADADAFIAACHDALSRRADPDYLEVLASEAEANAWSAKARQLLTVLDEAAT